MRTITAIPISCESGRDKMLQIRSGLELAAHMQGSGCNHGTHVHRRYRGVGIGNLEGIRRV
jgi:hypothetical protein